MSARSLQLYSSMSLWALLSARGKEYGRGRVKWARMNLSWGCGAWRKHWFGCWVPSRQQVKSRLSRQWYLWRWWEQTKQRDSGSTDNLQTDRNLDSLSVGIMWQGKTTERKCKATCLLIFPVNFALILEKVAPEVIPQDKLSVVTAEAPNGYRKLINKMWTGYIWKSV